MQDHRACHGRAGASASARRSRPPGHAAVASSPEPPACSAPAPPQPVSTPGASALATSSSIPRTNWPSPSAAANEPDTPSVARRRGAAGRSRRHDGHARVAPRVVDDQRRRDGAEQQRVVRERPAELAAVVEHQQVAVTELEEQRPALGQHGEHQRGPERLDVNGGRAQPHPLTPALRRPSGRARRHPALPRLSSRSDLVGDLACDMSAPGAVLIPGAAVAVGHGDHRDGPADALAGVLVATARAAVRGAEHRRLRDRAPAHQGALRSSAGGEARQADVARALGGKARRSRADALDRDGREPMDVLRQLLGVVGLEDRILAAGEGPQRVLVGVAGRC